MQHRIREISFALLGALCFLLLPLPAAPQSSDVARLVAQLGHSGTVYSVAFSPDGARVLTGSEDWTARLWDAATGAELHRFEGHSDSVWLVAFSPDGARVLTGSDDDTARLWDAATGAELRRFEVGPGSPVAFSPDGIRVLTGSQVGTARLWEVATGKEVQRFEGHEDAVSSVAFSSDGARVLTGSLDQTVRSWDVASGAEVQRFEGHGRYEDERAVNSVAFSPDGARVLTGSDDGTARLWDSATGKELQRLEGHKKGPVRSAAFSPDGARVLTRGYETSRLWDATTGRELLRLRVPEARLIESVAFSPDGARVLTASGDHAARLWDAATGEELQRFEFREWSQVWSATFSPDGARVLAGSSDKTTRMWDAATGEELQRFEGYELPVWSVAFSPDGTRVLTGSGKLDSPAQGTTRLWDASTGEEVQRFEGDEYRVSSVAFSPDGTRVLTGTTRSSFRDRVRGGTARLWDAATGKQLLLFQEHGDVNSVAFSPDGARALTGSEDGTTRLLDAATGIELQRFAGPSVVAFSPVGARVLTASPEGTARLWDAATSKEVQRFEGHEEDVTSAAFSPDGTRLLTGSQEGTARLWDAATGKELQRFDGHEKQEASGNWYSVAFSPDAARVLTGSSDKTARLWDAATGEEVKRFEGHRNLVTSVAFSPDGARVLTGSQDGTARLWDPATGEELVQLIAFPDGSWAVVDQEGRFDASNGGDITGLHWVVGLEPIALSQLKELYYDPGLLAKYMGQGAEDPLRTVKSFNERGVALYPLATITHTPEPGDTELRIHLQDRGGGIGRVAVSVNGKEVVADARPADADPKASTLDIVLDLGDSALFIPGEDNEIDVVTHNEEGYLASRGTIRIGRTSDRKAEPPSLWALVAGISDYAGKGMDLRYAAKDATDFAAGLTVAAEGLLGAERVHVSTLTDGAASRAGLEAALAELEQAKPQDILVVYLAGHGVTAGSDNEVDYYYLLHEALSARLDSAALREQVAMSSRELTERIKAIPALKQVLILDTCASGGLIDDLFESRSVSSGQIRSIERMKDRTGMFVLAGSAADSVSYEATRYGQGLLTYSLLMGMRGASLREEQFLGVSGWFSWAADQVPQLAKGIGGIQMPRRFGDGESFDLGMLTLTDREKIPLAREKPIVVRATFADQRMGDPLKLTTAVDEALRATQSLVFVDAREFPDAHRIAGRYKTDIESVEIEVFVYKGDEEFDSFPVEGLKDSPNAVAAGVVTAFEARRAAAAGN